MADRCVLLVEGKDDEHVFYHLLEYYHIPERFIIRDQNGIENLLESIPVHLKASDLEILGIVVDANTDLEARWQALRSILSKAGYLDMPPMPHPHGTVIEQNGRPTVGLWLMPDNRIPGTLEDFCGFLVPPDDYLWQKAHSCLEQIPESEHRFPPERRSKARIHTWLAWLFLPGKPLGVAITARYLDVGDLHAQQLIGWIHRLFDV